MLTTGVFWMYLMIYDVLQVSFDVKDIAFKKKNQAAAQTIPADGHNITVKFPTMNSCILLGGKKNSPGSLLKKVYQEQIPGLRGLATRNPDTVEY